MKQTVIIYAHPYEKSFNQAICDKVVETLAEQKKSYQLIDLYRDNFNPAYTKKELELFASGKTTDVLVEKYQQAILAAEKLIFIFPVWWNDLPAIVKGFIDKVMKKEFAYEITNVGIKGKLNNIKEVVVYTTATSPKWYLKFFAGNAIKKVFLKATIKQIGIKKTRWYHLGKINSISTEKRVDFLNNIKKNI